MFVCMYRQYIKININSLRRRKLVYFNKLHFKEFCVEKKNFFFFFKLNQKKNFAF